MATYREMVYMTLDEIKGMSDDFYYTEDHIVFLLDKYRAFLLKLRYSDVKREILKGNYLIMEINNLNQNIPLFLNITIPKLYDKTNNTIYNYTTHKRSFYLGHNRFLNNAKYFYFTLSGDYQKLNIFSLDKTASPPLSTPNTPDSFFTLEAVFESPKEVYKLTNPEDNILDLRFPIEESLVSPLLEMVVKDLLQASYRPEDSTNNTKDDLADIASYLRRNLKSDLLKQMGI